MMRRFTHLLILFSSFVALQAEKYDETFFNNLEWRNIGPNRGGRSLSSMGSPGRTNEYYFGATGGGLWKTTDGGNTWFPVTDGKPRQIRRAEGGGLGDARAHDRHVQQITLELHQQIVRACAAVDAEFF